MPSSAYPKILRSIGYHLYPTVPTESLRYILFAGSGLEKHEVMIGLTWMAQEILVLVIFFFFGVLHAFWGPDVGQLVWNAKALLKCSSKRRRDPLEARPVTENSPKNDDPNNVIEPRVENRPLDIVNV